MHTNIETQAIKELMELKEQEEEVTYDEQQGQSRVNKQNHNAMMKLSLDKRWEQHKKYEGFIEQARQMWD